MADKSKQRVEQDYARNVIHDRETGHDKAAAYEKRKLTEVAAGESSADKVHRHSRENRGNNYNPWDSTDEGISTLYTGEREGE